MDTIPTTVLGIDVGWSKKRRSAGFATLTIDDGIIVDLATTSAFVDDDDRWDALQRVTRGVSFIDGVGIDGPLLPGLIHDPEIPYRHAEEILSKGPFQKRGKAGQSSSAVGRVLHEHATRLAHLTMEGVDAGYFRIAAAEHSHAISDFNIVEAFPTGFMSVILSDRWHEDNPTDRKNRAGHYWAASMSTDGPLARVMESLGVSDPSRLLSIVTDRDERDAVICAITAMGVIRNRYTAVGDIRHGWIILADRESWGESADGATKWAEAYFPNE